MLPPLAASASDSRKSRAVKGSNTTGTSQVRGLRAPIFRIVRSTARLAISSAPSRSAARTAAEYHHEDWRLPVFALRCGRSSTAQERASMLEVRR